MDPKVKNEQLHELMEDLIVDENRLNEEDELTNFEEEEL